MYMKQGANLNRDFMMEFIFAAGVKALPPIHIFVSDAETKQTNY